MFTYVVVILISIIALNTTDASEKSPYLVNYIRKKCNSVDKSIFRKMEISQCSELHHELKTGEDYYRFYCEKKFGNRCMDIIVPYYVECLNSEEQYLSNFLISSFQEIDARMCSKEKAEYVKKSNILDNVECIANGTLSELTVKCFDTVFIRTTKANLFYLNLLCAEGYQI
ncbi:hypothetical protein FQR65_LT08117 [Abscondita terminalis]|nr:hypothetical protein FQR65_LT08117 [Abscondita terminalis]